MDKLCSLSKQCTRILRNTKPFCWKNLEIFVKVTYKFFFVPIKNNQLYSICLWVKPFFLVLYIFLIQHCLVFVPDSRCKQYFINNTSATLSANWCMYLQSLTWSQTLEIPIIRTFLASRREICRTLIDTRTKYTSLCVKVR